MDDKKTAFIDQQIKQLTRFWLGKLFLIGMVLFPLMGIMDYFVAPNLLVKFIYYRIAITVILFICYLINKIVDHPVAQYSLLIFGTAMCAVTVELMIMDLGGHASFYYAGLNLVIIAVLGFIPTGLVVSLISIAVIYGIYVIPILLSGPIVNLPVFVANNTFMISTIVISVSWRLLSQKGLITQLSLRYDLDIDRTKLASSSKQLKELLEERTEMYLDTEKSYRALFDNSLDGILVIDKNGIIVKANDKVHQLHNFTSSSLLGTNILLLQQEINKERIMAVIERALEGEYFTYETEHYKKDGSLVYLEICVNRITLGAENYLQMILRDITEKKKMHDHVLQSQKMASIGTLAGGIAHDLNNILTAILGNTELIRMKIAADNDPSSPITNSLNVVERAVRNGSRMINQLMDFARQNKPEILTLDINDIVKDTVSLLERVVNSNILIKAELDPTVPKIDGDITHLSQVVMNLVVNAKDAMPDGGNITLKTNWCPKANIHNVAPLYVPAADYVILTISDTGTGISEEVKERMFEPFFTTKQRGKGTGLGLAMVYSVVSSHRGFITVSSVINKGTTFTILFPVSKADKFRQYPFMNSIAKKNKFILIVEDDEANLAFIKETLEREKYKVVATTNPIQALDEFKRNKDSISLVITDIIMPIMNGLELTKLILEIKPEQKILTITGSSEIYSEAMDNRIILKKPFDSASLINNVKNMVYIQ